MILSNQEYVKQRIRDSFISSDNTGFIRNFLDETQDSYRSILSNIREIDNYNGKELASVVVQPQSISAITINKYITTGDRKTSTLTKDVDEKQQDDINKDSMNATITKQNAAITESKSKFAEIIQNYPDHRFSEYNKFNGLVEKRKRSSSAFEIDICLLGRNAVKFFIINTALVSDVIGLVFSEFLLNPERFKRTGEYDLDDSEEIKELLNDESVDVDDFGLFICESECGEVDDGLPALDSKREIGQFHFPYLAIKRVQRKVSVTPSFYVGSIKQDFSTTNEYSLTTTPSALYKHEPESTFNVVYLRTLKKPTAARISIPVQNIVTLTYRSKKNSSIIRSKSRNVYKSKVVQLYTERNSIQLIRLDKHRATFCIYARTNKKSNRSTFQFESSIGDFEGLKYIMNQ
ncbi:hypothetical protein GJ496_004809 [Pomphorhynchus laevis]|nr:hypothetical protein GJ496_004809 [Pomphorhynchus laevis]